MQTPQKLQTVTLDGHSLTLEALVAVARFGARVALSPQAKAVSYTHLTLPTIYSV